MVVKNVIVWKLFSVEILGCIIVICFDKIGILMINQMFVIEFVFNGLVVGVICDFYVEGIIYSFLDGKIDGV